MTSKTLLAVLCSLGLFLALIGSLVYLPNAAQAWQPALQGGASVQAAVGTGFTYQGRLTDAGSPASGAYDFEFKLYNAATSGTLIGTATQDDVAVSDGLFAVALDFGGEAFNGEARWLEVGVRPGSSAGAHTALTPRQPLTPAPYALALPGLRTQQNATSPNVIGGSSDNRVGAQVVGATIGGGGESGDPNVVMSNYGTVAGGWSNSAMAERSTVGGGGYNYASGENATVGGGWDNATDDYAATIGGGSNNRAYGWAASVGGGKSNEAAGDLSAIAGGEFISVAGQAAAVAGGSHITVTSDYAAVAGGEHITVTGQWAVVGGGARNVVSRPGHDRYDSAAATVAGGENNLVTEAHATIGGGGNNTATGYASVVAGGGGYEDYMTLLPAWPLVGNTASGAWSAVGGGGNNAAGGHASTVAGGFGNQAIGDYATIAGGGQVDPADPATANLVTENYGTISGGGWNTASGDHATVGGGIANTASGEGATVGGGNSNTASGGRATVGGGTVNTASGWAATVPGGDGNTAQGNYSFAAGRQAQANHDGAFVWADSTGMTFPSATPNEFAARASGGFFFATTADASVGATLNPGSGTWSMISDRNVKANFSPVDGNEVLARLAAIPIQTWNYKTQNSAIRHVGPTAQDFYAAFGVGEDDKHISSVDADGVALAAIQGLYEVVQEKDARIARLEAQNAGLEARVAALEQAVSAKGPPPQPARLPVPGWIFGGLLLAGLVVEQRRRGGREQP